MITLDGDLGATAFHHWSVKYHRPVYLLGIRFVIVKDGELDTAPEDA